MMGPNALALQAHYGELKMPVAIIAGEGDRLIDIEKQSARLHSTIPHSTFDDDHYKAIGYTRPDLQGGNGDQPYHGRE